MLTVCVRVRGVPGGVANRAWRACCREEKCGSFMETVAQCFDNPALEKDVCAAHMQAMLQCGRAHGAKFVWHNGQAVALGSGDVSTLPRKYMPEHVRREMALAKGAEEVRGTRGGARECVRVATYAWGASWVM